MTGRTRCGRCRRVFDRTADPGHAELDGAEPGAQTDVMAAIGDMITYDGGETLSRHAENLCDNDAAQCGSGSTGAVSEPVRRGQQPC